MYFRKKENKVKEPHPNPLRGEGAAFNMYETFEWGWLKRLNDTNESFEAYPLKALNRKSVSGYRIILNFEFINFELNLWIR